MATVQTFSYELPQKRVVFMGGHPNMTKKLRHHFPKWTFIADEQLGRCTSLNTDTVFYWTGHGSHKLMKYVYSRIPENASIHYVTSTNIPMLINEMRRSYFLQNDQSLCYTD